MFFEGSLDFDPDLCLSMRIWHETRRDHVGAKVLVVEQLSYVIESKGCFMGT